VIYNPIIAPIAVKTPDNIAALYPRVGTENILEERFPPTNINKIENIIKTK